MLLGYWYRLLNNMTAPELALEPAIAALGERYRAQHLFIALRHIADFALLDRKLIIEVDGNSHNTPRQREKDLEHTLALQVLGWTVFRCSNEEAMRAPWETVRAALGAVQTAPEGLQAALQSLRQSHPQLLEKPAKHPRSPKPVRRVKAQTGKTAAACPPRRPPTPVHSPPSRRGKAADTGVEEAHTPASAGVGSPAPPTPRRTLRPPSDVSPAAPPLL